MELGLYLYKQHSSKAAISIDDASAMEGRMKTHSSKPRKTSGRGNSSRPRAKDASQTESNHKTIKTKHERSDAKKSLPAKFQVEKILESVSDSFVALDTDWRYTYLNEKAAQTYARTVG